MWGFTVCEVPIRTIKPSGANKYHNTIELFYNLIECWELNFLGFSEKLPRVQKFSHFLGLHD